MVGRRGEWMHAWSVTEVMAHGMGLAIRAETVTATPMCTGMLG